MAASVCLFVVCVSVTRLREPRLPCIADVRVLLVASQRHRRRGIVAQRCDDDGRREGSPVQPELRRALSDRGARQRSPAEQSPDYTLDDEFLNRLRAAEMGLDRDRRSTFLCLREHYLNRVRAARQLCAELENLQYQLEVSAKAGGLIRS